jgi:membrane dipeptidase
LRSESRSSNDVTRAATRSPRETAAACGISYAAADLFLDSDVIDLHIESFSFTRVLGYDLRKRHRLGLNRALLCGQADLPRLIEVGLRGGLFSLTANPWLTPTRNRDNLPRLYERLKATLELDGRAAFVSSYAGYKNARQRNQVGAFLAIQGATLLGDASFPEQARELPLVSVGLLHLTKTHLGLPSAPSLGKATEIGLTKAAFELMEALAHRRIFVDLAHLHPKGFRDAVQNAPSSVPFIVTHTGISGVYPHWRNLDDEMLRAVAQRDGLVGLIYHSFYLGDPLLGGKLDTLVAHFRHAAKVIGSHSAATGMD